MISLIPISSIPCSLSSVSMSEFDLSDRPTTVFDVAGMPSLLPSRKNPNACAAAGYMAAPNPNNAKSPVLMRSPPPMLCTLSRQPCSVTDGENCGRPVAVAVVPPLELMLELELQLALAPARAVAFVVALLLPAADAAVEPDGSRVCARDWFCACACVCVSPCACACACAEPALSRKPDTLRRSPSNQPRPDPRRVIGASGAGADTAAAAVAERTPPVAAL